MRLLDKIRARFLPEPATHDFSLARGWGNNVQVESVTDGGKHLRVVGWTEPRPSKRDYVILSNRGATTRYQVIEVEHCRDPQDMWFAKLAFAPRTERP